MPGTNWLGPFNPLDAKPPTCHSDQIAKEHDFDYHFATRASEVRKADRRAIAGFAGDLVVNHSPYALVGLVGIGTKYCVETATGVIYPTGLNKFCRKKQETCRDIQRYHQNLDSIREAEEENRLNYESVESNEFTTDTHPRLESAGRRVTTLQSGVVTKRLVTLQDTPPLPVNIKDKGLTYNPYNKPLGYKDKDTWSDGPNVPENWSWFQKPKNKITLSNPTPPKPTNCVDRKVKITPQLVNVDRIREEPHQIVKKIIPASCGRPGCVTASESEASSSTQDDDWSRLITKEEGKRIIEECERALETPPPSRSDSPTLKKLARELTTIDRFTPPFAFQRVYPIEVLREMSTEITGRNMDQPGAESKEQEGAYGGAKAKRPRNTPEKDKTETKRKRSSLQKQARLRRLELDVVSRQLLDIEELEENIETWETEWYELENSKDLGKRPQPEAISRVAILKDNVIKPLLKAYKDLSDETVYLRSRVNDFTRLNDSIESMEKLFSEEQSQRRISESSTCSEMGANEVVGMLVELRKSLIENNNRMDAKITDLGRATQNVIGRIDKLEREGLQALSNKVEVVKRRIEVEKHQNAKVQQHVKTQATTKGPKPKQVTISRKTSFHDSRPEKETESELNPTTPGNTEDELTGWETVGHRRRRKAKMSRKERTEKREQIMSRKVETAIDRSKRQLKEPRRTIMVRKEKDAPSLAVELEAASSADDTGVRNRQTYAKALCSPKTLRKQIKQMVDAREDGLQIDGIRPVGATQVKVVAATPEQAIRLTNKLANAGFLVEKERLPDRPLMVKVRRVDRTIRKEDLASYLYTQNPWVRDCFPQLKDLEKVFAPNFQMGRRIDAKGIPYDDCIWVVRVSEALRKELLKQGKVYINLDTCPVSDFTEVTRCFRCQGYGHTAAKCLNEESCARCAGFHDTRTCPLANLPPNVTPEPRKCANCKRINLDYTHSVENPKCPVYRRALDRNIQRVNPLMNLSIAVEDRPVGAQ